MLSTVKNTNEKMQYQSVCVGMSDTVAQEALKNLSNYLSRYYKNKTGVNLFDEILIKRVEKAKEYLQSKRACACRQRNPA